MRLTSYTDYALRVLIHATVNCSQLSRVSDISAAYGISRTHLTKVVQRLGDLGFLETIRGRGGGLRLARLPEEITVGEVVRAMEEDFALAECFRGDHDACRITAACGLRTVLSEALIAYFAVLDRKTLADITANRGTIADLLGLNRTYTALVEPSAFE